MKKLKKIYTKLEKFSNTKKFELLAIVILLIAAFGVRLYKINIPVDDWHSWRQVDTASVARIYVEEGINLLYPRYYDISSIQTGFFNPEGLRFVEFPIYNVVHALSYKSFPQIQFEQWGRLISIFCSLVSSILIYILAKKSFGRVGALFSLLFFALIPFNIYYSRVILPEPMAVMFAVAAVLFFVYFDETNKKYFLFASAISFSLNLLVNPYTVFYGVPIAYLVLRKYRIKKIITNIPLLLALDIVLIPFILWRGWVNNDTNLIGVPHLAWAFNGNDIRFKPSWWKWIFGERLGNLILGIWGVVPFAFGLLDKSRKAIVVYILGVGMLLFVTVVASANVMHDYYQSIIMPAVVLILGIGAAKLWLSDLRSKILLIFSIFMMFLLGTYQVRGFYQINHPEFVTVGQIVDESLPKDAKVIVPDNGNTVFLYYTHRYGWPVLESSIDNEISKGAQYFVSVNNDADTNMLKARFNVFKQGPNYWIIDLTSPKS